jgi:hypothetical protein
MNGFQIPMIGSPSNPVSPKLSAAALGPAVAIVIWTLLSHLWSFLSPGEIAALTGSTGTIFAFILGYFTHDPYRAPTPEEIKALTPPDRHELPPPDQHGVDRKGK